MEDFNDDENDNKHNNNNLPNKQFIKYYWINIDQH